MGFQAPRRSLTVGAGTRRAVAGHRTV